MKDLRHLLENDSQMQSKTEEIQSSLSAERGTPWTATRSYRDLNGTATACGDNHGLGSVRLTIARSKQRMPLGRKRDHLPLYVSRRLMEGGTAEIGGMGRPPIRIRGSKEVLENDSR